MIMNLKKSKTDRVLFGVCGGLSESLNIDAPFLRLGFIIGAIFSGTMLFWIYLILAVVLKTSEK